jgi:hypothetical protein
MGFVLYKTVPLKTFAIHRWKAFTHDLILAWFQDIRSR